MKVLLVDDSTSDRKILRMILEERSDSQSEFFEAGRLDVALRMMDQNNFDCVVLDLNLPDSRDYDTFHSVYTSHPDVPIIILSASTDQDLARALVREGAVDYITKDFTRQDEIHRRILLALDRHRHSIRVPPDDVSATHQLTRARSRLISAQTKGEPKALAESAASVTVAIGDLTQRMFAEMQKRSSFETQQKMELAAIGRTVEALERELITGTPGHPGLKTHVELLSHRVGCLEEKVDDVEGDFSRKSETTLKKYDELEKSMLNDKLAMKGARLSFRSSLIVAIISLTGVLAIAAATYYSATTKVPSNVPGLKVK